MKPMKDNYNELLKRREVKIIIESESNPGFLKAGQAVADFAKKPEENIAVKEVKSAFGRNTFLIDAFVYDTKEMKDKIEPKKKEKKALPQ